MAADLDARTVLLLLLGAVIVLPALTMGMGFGGMMGYGGMGGSGAGGGMWPLVGVFVPVVVLLAVLVGGYLLVRGGTDDASARNPAMEELRTAYARGDLTDEEFEARQERLSESE